MSVRRTKKEIDAGFPLNLKEKGVKFEDWLKKKETKTKSKAEAPIKEVSTRVRRTKEETEAGFPLAAKAKGIKFEDWLAEEKAKKEEAKRREELISEPKPKIRKMEIDPPPAFKQENKKEEEKKPEIQYIKHTERVIVETKQNSKELRDLIAEAVSGLGIFEWKYIKVGAPFDTSIFDEMGAKGWRLMHIDDKRDASGKNTQLILCFQRLKT